VVPQRTLAGCNSQRSTKFTRWLADKSAAVSEYSLIRYAALNRGER
jgi:hypothetical protein